MHYKRTFAILLLCLWSAAMPAGAQAAAPDTVFVDPDGPAGREYELPLDAAREDAAAGSGRDEDEARSGRSSPLFGSGITPSRTRPQDSSVDGAPSDHDSIDPTEDESSSASGRTGSSVDVRGADVDSGTHSGMTIALGAVLVLAVGALVGVVLRRPSSKSDHDDASAA